MWRRFTSKIVYPFRNFFLRLFSKIKRRFTQHQSKPKGRSATTTSLVLVYQALSVKNKSPNAPDHSFKPEVYQNINAIFRSIDQRGLVSSAQLNSENFDSVIRSDDTFPSSKVFAVLVKSQKYLKSNNVAVNKFYGYAQVAMERIYEFHYHSLEDIQSELNARLRQSIVLIFNKEALLGNDNLVSKTDIEQRLQSNNRKHLMKVLVPSHLKDIASSHFKDVVIEVVDAVANSNIELSSYVSRKLNSVNNLNRHEIMTMSLTWPDYARTMLKISKELKKEFAFHIVRLPTNNDIAHKLAAQPDVITAADQYSTDKKVVNEPTPILNFR